MSDLEAALAEAIHATGIGRYRDLCAADNPAEGPGSAERWRRWILERRWEPSAMPEADRPPVAESLALTRAMDSCPYRSTQGCGCSGARCALRRGTVSHVDCFDCLRRYPEPS